MELWLNNGDYVIGNGNGLVRLENEEALLQRVLFRLCARRGAFPLLPKIGSRLYLLGKEKSGTMLTAAREYVEEALEDENVAVERVTVSDGDGCLVVAVLLRSADKQRIEVKVEV